MPERLRRRSTSENESAGSPTGICSFSYDSSVKLAQRFIKAAKYEKKNGRPKPTVHKTFDVCRRFLSALPGIQVFYFFRCQIKSLYSLIVRSEEKMPEQAVLVMAMRSHFSRFW